MLKFTAKYLVVIFVCLGFRSFSQCTVSAIYSVGPNGAVTFSSTSTPQSSLSTFYWNFGNGQSYSVTGVDTAATTYTASGNYIASLTLSNPTPSCNQTFTFIVSIVIQSCHASFTEVIGPAGQVTLNSTSTGTNIVTKWYYGDGNASNSSTAISAVHQYTPDTYQVMLEIHASGGCVDSVVKPVTVPCYTMAHINSAVQSPNGLVNFHAGTVTTAPILYVYHFGDGDTLQGLNVAHTYSSNGNYVVVLSSKLGYCLDYDTMNLKVNTYPCPAMAALLHTVGLNGKTQFISSKANPGMFCRWNFGDGYIALGCQTSHDYQNAGSYLVTLTVIDSIMMCRDSLIQAINITDVECKAVSFFSVTQSGASSFSIATPIYPWNVSAVLWEWGDGTTSNQLYATHQYTAAGNYTACLSVTVSCGSDSKYCYPLKLTKPGSINVVAPDPVLTGIDVHTAEFAFYPNPFSNELIVEHSCGSRAEVQLFDLSGRKISSAESYDEKLVLDVSRLELKTGMYLLRFSCQEGVMYRKVIHAP